MDGIVERYIHRRGFGWIRPLIGKPDSRDIEMRNSFSGKGFDVIIYVYKEL